MSADKRAGGGGMKPPPPKRGAFGGGRGGGGRGNGGTQQSQPSQADKPAFLNDEIEDEGDDFMEEEDVDYDMEAAAEQEAGPGRAAVVSRATWPRPDVKPWDPRTESLCFQQLEIDTVNSRADAQYGRVRNFPAPDGREQWLVLPEAPVLRVFGVSDAGHSVCLHVHGFEPYFYIPAWRNYSPEEAVPFATALANRIKESRARVIGPCVVRVETAPRQSIFHYFPEDKVDFVKIFVATPAMVATARGILEKGLHVPNTGCPQTPFVTFDSGVLFPLRFMIDANISGGSWVELPAGSYRVRPDAPTAKGVAGKASHCQIEVDTRWDTIVAHAPEGKWARLSKLRILSVDIECCGRKGHFPEAELDPVIQIASLVTVQGERRPAVKAVMTLRGCAPIVGAHVLSFSDEGEMLLAWRDLVVQTDPDIIIGYNIANFDLPYLLNRAATLKKADFPTWGRMKGSKLRMRDATFSSKAYGTRESKEITIEGRVQFDLMQAIQRDHKLSSYSLNAVSAHFLGEQKEDVHHSCIADLQNGNDETRRRLAVYCLKDAYLPQRLLEKLMMLYNYVEMARVTGVPLSFLLSRGQSIKVFSQLLRKARQRDLVVPTFKPTGAGAQADGGVAYEGATVLDAKAAYYNKPVATLDFASLYPSIMMAHNLCYCTLLRKGDTLSSLGLSPEDVLEVPGGERFVKAAVRRGILPEILEELLAARKRAKADLKLATDPMERAVLDGRQLALKVSANSVYGFTGATVGKLPCLEISSSVTAFGRTMIDQTRDLVQARYTIANGYAADAEVIYGDTDSVMVNFHVADVGEAMRLGRDAAEHISATFVKPIKLEFEKVYYPYLLISKKRYAGLLWTQPDKHDKMDTKGIETVRRDNCLLVKNVVTECLHRLLVMRDVPGACAYVKATISDLLMNRLDLSLLVITKGLTQEAEDYKVKAAHVELAERMKKRDEATAPGVGDRVAYVIIKAAKGAKAYEKSEDPIYALENNLPIDAQHYLEHHLSQPLMRLFEPIMKNPEQLLRGDHTRTISLSTPSASLGGIMRFAKVQQSCLGCKTLMPPGTDAAALLCQYCVPKEGEVYQKSLATVSALQSQFAMLWTQCQRCSGTLHKDVLCTSRDCPIFYRRVKVAKDLREADATLARFADTNW